jgi:hypothetical protein
MASQSPHAESTYVKFVLVNAIDAVEPLTVVSKVELR